jgi:hypothetical protein
LDGQSEEELCSMEGVVAETSRFTIAYVR